MLVKGIRKQDGTLRKLANLMKDEQRKVHGVFYTNSFFSQRYLSRSHVLVDNINIEDNEVRLTVSSRLEQVGLLEIENTLDMLVRHEAGDIPGFTPEGIYQEEGLEHTDRPVIPEIISVKQHLFSVDVLLIMKDVEVTFQEFRIAGNDFTLINLHNKLEEDFEQTVSILFGSADKFYFFSHFYNKNLSTRDTKLIMDLLVDENITGKAITGIQVDAINGVGTNFYPMNSLIGSFTSSSGVIIFSTDTGYVRIPKSELSKYKMHCTPNGESGAYRLVLESSQHRVTIFME